PSSGAGAGRGFKTKDGPGGGGPSFQVDHRRFTATNVNLFGLIVRAYAVKTCRPLGLGECYAISGGPDWLKKDRFDIQAKIPDDTPEYNLNQFQSGQAPQLQLMLQALLADRFRLKIRREKKQLPVYVLTIAKKGHKLKKSGEAEMVQLNDGSLV